MVTTDSRSRWRRAVLVFQLIAAGQTRATTADLGGTIVDQSVRGASRRDGDRAERRHQPRAQRDDRRAGTFPDSSAAARHV